MAPQQPQRYARAYDDDGQRQVSDYPRKKKKKKEKKKKKKDSPSPTPPPRTPTPQSPSPSPPPKTPPPDQQLSRTAQLYPAQHSLQQQGYAASALYQYGQSPGTPATQYYTQQSGCATYSTSPPQGSYGQALMPDQFAQVHQPSPSNNNASYVSDIRYGQSPQVYSYSQESAQCIPRNANYTQAHASYPTQYAQTGQPQTYPSNPAYSGHMRQYQ